VVTTHDKIAREIAEIAEKLSLELDQQQTRRLAEYAALVIKWQAITNLTAATSATQFAREHIADCLTVTPHIAGQRLLDVGSGAGLPGIVLSIARPGLAVTVLEPRARRARFLTQAKIELDLTSLEVVCQRLEQFRPRIPIDVVICRAFGSLIKFVTVCATLQVPGQQLLAMKSVVDADELEAAEGLAGPARVVPLKLPGYDDRNLVIFESATYPDSAAGRK
jgi:16S rRNA (guanine527-N7)-methyltransferase